MGWLQVECTPEGQRRPIRKTNAQAVFAKCPLPLISRWYIADSAARYVFSLFSFGILANYVGSCRLLFWPCDSPEQPQTEPVEYRNWRLKHSEMLKNSVRSEEMRTALVVSNISSPPRWHYARRLTISKDDLNPPPESGSGAYSGLGGIFPTHRKYSPDAIFTRNPLSIVAQDLDLIGFIDGVLFSDHTFTMSRRICPTLGLFGALSAASFRQRESFGHTEKVATLRRFRYGR